MGITKTYILISMLLILLFSKTVLGLNEDTHKFINNTVAEITLPNGFLLNDYLVNQINLTNGIKEEFDNKEVIKLLGDGGVYEDKPPWVIPYLRSINHFHDPISNMGYHYGVDLGWSSIEWALMDKETQLPGGYYSWIDVMSYYKSALTEPYQEYRNTYFAETFRGLGQLMHLVQDASSPAHTRNDQHPEYNYEIQLNS